MGRQYHRPSRQALSCQDVLQPGTFCQEVQAVRIYQERLSALAYDLIQTGERPVASAQPRPDGYDTVSYSHLTLPPTPNEYN